MMRADGALGIIKLVHGVDHPLSIQNDAACCHRSPRSVHVDRCCVRVCMRWPKVSNATTKQGRIRVQRNPDGADQGRGFISAYKMAPCANDDRLAACK